MGREYKMSRVLVVWRHNLHTNEQIMYVIFVHSRKQCQKPDFPYS